MSLDRSRSPSTRTALPTRATSRSRSSAASSLDDDEAARRALPGRPAVDSAEGNLEGRGTGDAKGRRHSGRWTKASSPRARPRSCSRGPFQYRPDSTHRDSRDGHRAREPAARRAPRRSRRHVQCERVADLRQVSTRGIRVSIDFGCSPDRTEALIKTVFDRDRKAQGLRSDRTAGRGCEGRLAPGLRAEHEAERLSASISCRCATSSAKSRRSSSRIPDLYKQARRRRDSAGRAHVSRHEQLRQGDALSGKEVVTTAVMARKPV